MKHILDWFLNRAAEEPIPKYSYRIYFSEVVEGRVLQYTTTKRDISIGLVEFSCLMSRYGLNIDDKKSIMPSAISKIELLEEPTGDQ